MLAEDAGILFHNKQTSLNNAKHVLYTALRSNIFSLWRLKMTVKGSSCDLARNNPTISLNDLLRVSGFIATIDTSSNFVSNPRPLHNDFVLTTIDL